MDIETKRKQANERKRRFRAKEKLMGNIRTHLLIDPPLLWLLKQPNGNIASHINDLHTANLTADGFKCPELRWDLQDFPQTEIEIKLDKAVYDDFQACQKPSFPSWVVEWMLIARMHLDDSTGKLAYTHPNGSVIETGIVPVLEADQRAQDAMEGLQYRHFCRYENRLRVMKIHKLHLDEQPDWDAWHAQVDKIPPASKPKGTRRVSSTGYPLDAVRVEPSFAGLARQKAVEAKYGNPVGKPVDGDEVRRLQAESEEHHRKLWADRPSVRYAAPRYRMLPDGSDELIPETMPTETPQAIQERAKATWSAEHPDVPWEMLFPKDQQLLIERAK